VAAPEVAEKPAADVPPEPAVAAPADKPKIDYNAETPPPTPWDRERSEHGLDAEFGGESIGAQILRMLVSLGAVVALIYLFAKYLLPRLIGAKMIGRGTKTLKLRERLQLDARHSLFVVELEDGRTMLLGGGDSGINVLETLSGDSESKDGFDTVLAAQAQQAPPTQEP